MCLKDTISVFIMLDSSPVLLSEKGINVFDFSFLCFIFSEIGSDSLISFETEVITDNFYRPY